MGKNIKSTWVGEYQIVLKLDSQCLVRGLVFRPLAKKAVTVRETLKGKLRFGTCLPRDVAAGAYKLASSF